MFDPNGFVALSMPDDPDKTRMYSTEGYNLRLKSGSSAIDQGEVLDNITDGYSGKAPDIGADEFGQESPHYGPRH